MPPVTSPKPKATIPYRAFETFFFSSIFKSYYYNVIIGVRILLKNAIETPFHIILRLSFIISGWTNSFIVAFVFCQKLFLFSQDVSTGWRVISVSWAWGYLIKKNPTQKITSKTLIMMKNVVPMLCSIINAPVKFPTIYADIYQAQKYPK